MRTFSLKKDNFEGVVGNHAVVIPPENLNEYIYVDLEKLYHRKNITLKIFKATFPWDRKIEEVRWSDGNNGFRENLLECTKIQNLLALQGYSPRVYDLVFLDYKDTRYAAQITDWIEKEEGDINIDRIKEFCEKVGIKYHDIENDGGNMRGGLFTDTQEFEFLPEYEEGLKYRLERGLAYAGMTEVPYQTIEELGIKGERKNDEREKFIKFRGLPEDFSIMDFGCNGAYFMRRAFDYGAVYGVGVDIPRVCQAAAELNNYLGYFNMDFVSEVPNEKFDCVLLLAAFTYAKIDEIFPKGKVAYIEGHCLNGEHTEENYKKKLEPYYTNIETLGWVQDEPHNPPRVVMRGER